MVGSSTPNIRVALREPTRKRKRVRPPVIKRKWKRRDIPRQDSERFVWTDPNVDTSRLPQSPESIFDLFFDEDVIDMIVENTNIYAGSKENNAFRTSAEEF